MTNAVEFTFPQRVAAWGVHLLTAAGAVVGLMALIATADERWRAAFVWMGVTLVIDSIDGSLARACRVKQVLPQFDGALLDNIVDYFTYVIVPAFFLYWAPVVPAGWALLSALAITLASAYQFCQSDAKTDDHFFKGFPSYWNIVVLYLFMFPLPRWMNLIIILALAVGVFVPIKYLYPSRTRVLRPLTLLLTSVWGVLMVLTLARYPEGHRAALYGSFLYVLYYFGMSAYLTSSDAARRRTAHAPLDG
jgi:phosphatidylcholine synthase